MNAAQQPPEESSTGDSWFVEFNRSLEENRTRAQQLFEDHRQQAHSVESTLKENIRQLSEQVHLAQQDVESRESAVQQHHEDLQRRSQQLAKLKQQLAKRQANWNDSQEESAQMEHALLQRLQDQLQEIDRQRSSLEEERAELHSRRRQWEDGADHEGSAMTSEGLDAWMAERQQLLDQLAQAESRLEAAEVACQQSPPGDDLHERNELALQELEQLKARNWALQEQLNEAPSSRREEAAHGGIDAGMDWEAQKQRLLQQLDSEMEDDHADDSRRTERLQIEEAIRVTEFAVEEREREIAELKYLLDQQSSNVGGVAIGAAAIAEVLDHDELISQERESLRAMQDEWREKLRKAEIEISTERAKLARERMALEERIAMLESDHAGGKAKKSKSGSSKPRRHWLARLGIADAGDDSR